MKARTYSLLSGFYHKRIDLERTSFTVMYSSYNIFGRLCQSEEMFIRRPLTYTEKTQNLCPLNLALTLLSAQTVYESPKKYDTPFN